jgi:hypothetical protein
MSATESISQYVDLAYEGGSPEDDFQLLEQENEELRAYLQRVLTLLAEREAAEATPPPVAPDMSSQFNVADPGFVERRNWSTRPFAENRRPFHREAEHLDTHDSPEQLLPSPERGSHAVSEPAIEPAEEDAWVHAWQEAWQTAWQDGFDAGVSASQRAATATSEDTFTAETSAEDGTESGSDGDVEVTTSVLNARLSRLEDLLIQVLRDRTLQG